LSTDRVGVEGSRIRTAPWILGEFALIVVGVLVALYAQEFVDRHGQVAMANEYVSRLQSDVESDIADIERRITFFTAVEEAGRRTLAWLESGAPDDDQALLMAVLSSELLPFAPNTTTYRDLQATGNFVLITDMDLRASLDRYHSLMSVRTRAGGTWDLPEEYRKTLRGIVPLELHALMVEQCGVAEQTITANLQGPCRWAPGDFALLTKTLQALRAAPGLEEQLRFLLSQMIVGTRLYRSQLRSAHELRAQLGEASK